jgi:cytochrome c oxidase subunit 2
MSMRVPGILAQADLPPVDPGGGTTWLPPQASSAAVQVDAVFYFIFWVAVFFFVLIVGLLVVFVWRYRRRTAGAAAVGGASHSTALEITWLAIPLVLVGAMFYMGFRGYMDMFNPPAGALGLHVIGQKWSWSFVYPNGHVDTELHVPVSRPVLLTLSSSDVIHSLFIPAFRVKRDAVPGRYNKIWFRATQAGEYLALCAQYCGTRHSDMLARVVVHPPGQYEQWLDEASDPFRTRSPAEVGRLLVTRRCGGCHTVDGKANIGPTFKGLFGQMVKFKDGRSAVADENYIRESILYPNQKIVAGFEPVMPTFRGQLKDEEILAIIEFVKELGPENGSQK